MSMARARGRAAAVAAACLLGCSSAQDGRDSSAPPLLNVRVGADSGVWQDQETLGRWKSVVVNGRVREIRERVVLHRTLSGDRVYQYDSTGVLRYFSEQVRRVPPSALDSPAVIRPIEVRESTIDFLAGIPALSSRRYGNRHIGFSRFERRALQSRGYALFDSATRAAR